MTRAERGARLAQTEEGVHRLVAEVDGRVVGTLGLRRLELHVYPDNAVAINLYEKIRFVIEGTARDFALQNGVFIDVLMMARLRTDLTGDARAQSR